MVVECESCGQSFGNPGALATHAATCGDSGRPDKTERIVIKCTPQTKDRWNRELEPSYADHEEFVQQLLDVKEDHPELFTGGLWG